MNLQLFSLAIAGFGISSLLSFYLRHSGVSVDFSVAVPLFGSLATVVPGLWGIYSWADQRLSSAEESMEQSNLKLEGEIARIDARVQILLENRAVNDRNR